MIGNKLWDIKREIAEHFKDTHGAPPKPDLRKVNFNSDFKQNDVYLESNGSLPLSRAPPHPFTFQSRLFCSDDYCVAVITYNNYYDCERWLKLKESREEKQKSLELTLYPYFPSEHHATAKRGASKSSRA